MTAYLLSRLGLSALVILGVSVVVFLLTHLSGDPALLMLPQNATAEDVARFRAQYGYDQPLQVQYLRFLGGALRGDFGNSIRHAEPALPLIAARLPATFQLSLTAVVLAVVLAVPLGVVSAAGRGTWVDLVGMFFALIGQSVPNFWLAIMMILVLAVNLGLLPTSGRESWQSTIMPAVAIALNLMALLTRLVRSSMLEVLGEDYVRTARAKGLAGSAVIVHHALRNALVPLVTVVGLQFGFVLGGAVVIETVFMWPGLGLFTIQAITNRDFPVVQAAVFILASAVVLINLVVDLVYHALDPRIRVGG